jgi:hypothetical protein
MECVIGCMSAERKSRKKDASRMKSYDVGESSIRDLDSRAGESPSPIRVSPHLNLIVYGHRALCTVHCALYLSSICPLSGFYLACTVYVFLLFRPAA